MNLLHLFYDIDNNALSLDISPWLSLIPVAFVVFFFIKRKAWRRLKFKTITLNIPFGGVGSVVLKPNLEDLQIAHRIWAELITRKAAIPIDPENDVLIEVYDSWYKLFGIIRELIAEIPIDLIRTEASTRSIIIIATKTLNDGLRPHLTKWQARFRNWHRSNNSKLDSMTPQELQEMFPEYTEMLSEMLIVNDQLIQYSVELKKMIDLD